MNGQQTVRTVLVGVDGSDHALRAVRWAAAEADRRQLPLRLVLAFTWVAEPDFEVLTGDEHYRNMLLQQARARLAQAASTATETRPALAVQQQLIIGYPAEVLAAESRRAAQPSRTAMPCTTASPVPVGTDRRRPPRRCTGSMPSRRSFGPTWTART